MSKLSLRLVYNRSNLKLKVEFVYLCKWERNTSCFAVYSSLLIQYQVTSQLCSLEVFLVAKRLMIVMIGSSVSLNKLTNYDDLLVTTI